MAALPGLHLGPYEILSAIGAGGMGDVYRAKDTRLDPVVAIKVLPSHLAVSPDIERTVEREARTIASLNYSDICAVAALACLIAAIVAGLAVWNLKPAPSTRPVSRFTITLPPGQQLAGLDTGTAVALSPDGTHLAYVATQGGIQQLYLRAMDSLEAKPIPVTEGAVSPFCTTTIFAGAAPACSAGTSYLVMELVSGETLAKRVKRDGSSR
jgi:serine/threonine protein kinase